MDVLVAGTQGHTVHKSGVDEVLADVHVVADGQAVGIVVDKFLEYLVELRPFGRDVDERLLDLDRRLAWIHGPAGINEHDAGEIFSH